MNEKEIKHDGWKRLYSKTMESIIEGSLDLNMLDVPPEICRLITNQNLDIFPYLQLPITSNKSNLQSWFDKAKREGKFKSNINNSTNIYYYSRNIISVKVTLSDWFNMAKTKGHFDPIQKKYTEIDYYEIVSKLIIIQDPLIKNKLANWFDKVKNNGHFKPKTDVESL